MPQDREREPARAANRDQQPGKDTFRQSILSALLRTIHYGGPLSRANLSKQLGLSKSALAGIISELTQAGLVREFAEPQLTGAGRPAHVVSPASSIVALAIALDSDVIRIGAIGFDGHIFDSRSIPTANGRPPKVIAAIKTEVERLSQAIPEDLRIIGAGIAVPGQIDPRSGQVLGASRLGWGEIDLAGPLTEALGIPVWIENNARIVAGYEHRSGHGAGVSDLLYIFSSFGGIGGGLIVNNQLVRGATGLAGELGHMRISENDNSDFGGKTGTLEALVRRDELESEFQQGLVNDHELGELILRSESPSVARIAEHQLRTLGVALGNLANTLNPELIILGGFLGSLFQRFPEHLLDSFTQIALRHIAVDTRFASAPDASVGLLDGAADLVFSRLVSSPGSFVD